MAKYLMSFETDKYRKIKDSKVKQDGIEKYLSLALGCQVKLIKVSEIDNYQEKRPNKRKKP